MKHLLIIALGGSIGAVTRYLAAKNIHNAFNILFPLGTLFVNASGAFIIGFLYAFFDMVMVPRDVRSFLTIGFLGAYTTFSTYSLETINLLRDGEIKICIANILFNNILCLLFVITGIMTSRLLLKMIR